MKRLVISGGQRENNSHRCQLCNWWEGVVIIHAILIRITFGNEPRTHWDLASQSTPTDIQLVFFSGGRTTRCRFYSVLRLAFLPSWHLSNLGYRGLLTDLGTKYESIKEINAWKERQMWIRYKAKNKMRCASAFTLTKSKKVIIRDGVSSNITKG